MGTMQPNGNGLEAIAAEDEALQKEWEHHCYNGALEDRFKEAGPAEVLRMFKDGVNEKGHPLSQFEFEALCERWCAVFGELPPLGDAPPIQSRAVRSRLTMRCCGCATSFGSLAYPRARSSAGWPIPRTTSRSP